MNDGTFKVTVSMQRRLLVINWYSPPGSDGTSSHCVNSLTCGYQYQTKLLQYIIRMAFNKTTVQNHSKDTAQDAKPSVVQFCHSKETKVWRIQNKYKSTCRQKQTKRLWYTSDAKNNTRKSRIRSPPVSECQDKKKHTYVEVFLVSFPHTNLHPLKNIQSCPTSPVRLAQNLQIVIDIHRIIDGIFPIHSNNTVAMVVDG